MDLSISSLMHHVRDSVRFPCCAAASLLAEDPGKGPGMGQPWRKGTGVHVARKTCIWIALLCWLSP